MQRSRAWHGEVRLCRELPALGSPFLPQECEDEGVTGAVSMGMMRVAHARGSGEAETVYLITIWMQERKDDARGQMILSFLSG